MTIALRNKLVLTFEKKVKSSLNQVYDVSTFQIYSENLTFIAKKTIGIECSPFITDVSALKWQKDAWTTLDQIPKIK